MTTPSSPPPVLPDAAAARLIAGDLKVLEEGLRRGLRVDACWPMWECPLLHGVCLFGPPQAAAMVGAILDKGASLTDTYRGLTPMMCALAGFNRETGDALGARLAMIKALQAADPHSEIELWAMSAVRLGYKDALLHFLDSGCSVDAAPEGGHTLLHEAYSRKDTELGNLLVTRGARVDAKDARGKKPNEVNQPSEHAIPVRGELEELEAIDLAIRALDNSENAPESRHLRL